MASDNKGTWTDLGAVLVYETNGKNVKYKDKKGVDYRAGSGVLTLHGAMFRVWITVRKGGRSGSEVVGISMVEDTPPVQTLPKS